MLLLFKSNYTRPKYYAQANKAFEFLMTTALYLLGLVVLLALVGFVSLFYTHAWVEPLMIFGAFLVLLALAAFIAGLIAKVYTGE